MGRRGQGEMAQARVSSDAMPALTGSRCAGTGLSGRVIPANKVVPQNVDSVLVPQWGSEDFFYCEEYAMLKKLPGKRWCKL